MRKRILRIRTFYWFGAILDARLGIVLLVKRYLEMPDFMRNSDSGATLLAELYSVGQDCGLMWGWTFLLIWADRKPLARRGIILLTVFPVVFLLLTNVIDIILRGADVISNQSINIGIGIILIVWGLYCYIEAGKIEKELH